MRLPETRDMFTRRLEFPIACETVIERIGDVKLDAPTGDGETVGEVLGRCGEETFESADDLYGALIGSVGDEYIGRKYYDDRGSQPSDPDEEVSF